MAKEFRLQVVETYDSFRPAELLDVKFILAKENEPSVVRTFRSAYYSIRGLYDGCLTPTYTQLELDFRNGKNLHI